MVLDAIGDPAVGAAWNSPSILEEQLVGGLAGHLARGAVWTVDEYLDGGEPASPRDFASAAEYFYEVMKSVGEAEHRSVRERGAAVGAVGQAELVATLAQRLGRLRSRLAAEPSDRNIAVIAGRVLSLDDYLVARMVEQVVHLDDLARSVDHAEGWPLPAETHARVFAVGVEIARLRHGVAPVTRAMYRRGFADIVFPVL